MIKKQDFLFDITKLIKWLDFVFCLCYYDITKLMKGAIVMEDMTLQETVDILKCLTPQNQAYFMTLVRVAQVAENGVKSVFIEKTCKLPENHSI